VVETKFDNLQLPISIDGRPRTAKEKQQANLHVQKLVPTLAHAEVLA